MPAPSTREQMYLILAPFCLRQIERAPHLPEELEALLGRETADNFAQRFPSGTWGSLTCSKSTTRVKQLKVPSEGLRSLNFSVLKNSTTSGRV
jgi:hypothetical protein